MSPKPDKWFAVSVTVTTEYIEAAEFAFNNLDSLGSEVDLLSNKNSDLCTVTAYFSSRPDEGSIVNELRKAADLHGVPEDVHLVVRQTVVHEQDWLAEWKKHWRPVEIGRFVIAAPWHDVGKSDKIVIRIEPNMAFGTGTHETTQLVLNAISLLYRPEQSFLDIGTGTGILAIAAAKIANDDVSIGAVDIDADAVAIARLNAEQNGIGEKISFGTGSIGEIEGRFDLVCANLTGDVIINILPDLFNATNETLVLSGILAEQEDMVTEHFPSGTNYEVSRAGEWVAVTIKKG